MSKFHHPLDFNIPEILSPGHVPWAAKPAVPPPNVKAKILSVVLSANLGVELNLSLIANKGINLTYKKNSERPKAYTPLILRQEHPVSSAMVFKSGKISVTAQTSEDHAKIALYKFAEMISDVGYPGVAPAGIQITNIMAQTHVGFRIKLDQMYTSHAFPPCMLTYDADMGYNRMDIDLVHPKATVIVFESGTILFTGMREEKDAQEALNIVYPLFKLFSR